MRTPHLSKADLFSAKPFCVSYDNKNKNQKKKEAFLNGFPKPQLPNIVEILLDSGNIFGQHDIKANTMLLIALFLPPSYPQFSSL